MSEAEFWAGDMGREWARQVEALDRQLAPAGAAGLAALAARPGEHILDLGCGAGATTVEICKAVGPGGKVTGADISPDQIAAARARPGTEGAEFIVGNAQTWPFKEAVYDALFSRFGCMFFEDPPIAFSNLHRALKPGARAVMTVWRDLSMNAWAAVPARIGVETLGPAEPVPPGTPGPFAWADPMVFRSILEGSGFSAVEWNETPLELQVGESGDAGPVDRACSMLLRIGPLARRLKGLPHETRDMVKARLAPALAPYVRDGWVRMPGLIWVVRARA